MFQPSDHEPGGVYAIVERSGTLMHFQIRRGDHSERERQSIERDIYFYVEELDALHGELKGWGAVIRQGPHMAPYGIREIVVEDLSGYRLTFGQYDPAV